jgi:hypothetical protein
MNSVRQLLPRHLTLFFVSSFVAMAMTDGFLASVVWFSIMYLAGSIAIDVFGLGG